MKNLRNSIRTHGEKFPKKHGEWYRLRIWGDNYLIYDTWNKQVYHHKGCVPSDTNNMYGVVYVFSGLVGDVKEHMAGFWNAMHKCKNK